MERDPAFKQVIPYLVLRDGPRYFLMQRTTAGRRRAAARPLLDRRRRAPQPRRRRRCSAGCAASGPRSSSPTSCPTFRLVALLNDDTTEVGAVHLGAVYVADAAGRPVAIRETDKLTGSFVEPAEVAAVADRLETWSRLVFEFLAGFRGRDRTADGRSATAGAASRAYNRPAGAAIQQRPPDPACSVED